MDYVAEDFSDIAARLKQIQDERSTAINPCCKCLGCGWIPEEYTAPGATVRWAECPTCGNLAGHELPMANAVFWKNKIAEARTEKAYRKMNGLD
jgi:hypothetical protein